MTVATGIGYDVHRFAEGPRLVLGGVEIEHDRGLEGWSDADVLTHAVIDALLGAAGMGDIGEHFPDHDPAYEGADSIDLLEQTVMRIRVEGCIVLHVDATVVIEAPMLGVHRDEMRVRLAHAIGIAPAHVNVKATRGEGMGFVGREEGVAALAVATVEWH